MLLPYDEGNVAVPVPVAVQVPVPVPMPVAVVDAVPWYTRLVDNGLLPFDEVV